MNSSSETGMTLIEVLIASVILFVAITAISYVSQAMLLNQTRLARAVENAHVLEYIQDEVSYRVEYESQTQGEYQFDGKTYYWRIEVISQKPVLASVGSSESGDATNGVMVLYSTKVFSQLSPTPRLIAQFKSVYWHDEK